MGVSITAKDYLLQVKQIDIALANLAAELKQIEKLEFDKADSTCMQSNASKDGTGNLAVKKVGIEANILREQDTLMKDKAAIIANLKKVKNVNVDSYNVLHLRYVQWNTYKHWEDIAEHLTYSVEWVYKKHKKGLKIIESILESVQSNTV